MLILTRRIGEKLTIGDDTEIAILDIKGSQVRVGITAPQDVLILREELLANDNEEGADVLECARIAISVSTSCPFGAAAWNRVFLQQPG